MATVEVKGAGRRDGAGPPGGGGGGGGGGGDPEPAGRHGERRALDDQDIMAAAGPGDGQEVETVVNRKPACPRDTTYDPLGPEMVYTRGSVRGTPSALEHAPLHLQTTAPMMPLGNMSANREAPYRYRSPESVEMDEIMAAMVLTSLSSGSVVQKPLHPEPAEPPWSADMDCSGGGDCIGGGGGGGGGELSDSGSSGFWSWDPSSVSPAPSPSVTEMDSSPDEGLHMELEQGEELSSKKAKCCVRGVYKCLWPGCAKVLTSSVGIKRHIRMLHLGSGSEYQREEDFYYTRLSSHTPEPLATPPPAQATPPQPTWTPCGSPPASDLPPPPFRPRAHSACGTGVGGATPLSRSAPSSFWQIHSEHLYQACPVSVAPWSPAPQAWSPAPSTPGHKTNTAVKPRCRSVSVGEQWLQNNSTPCRLQNNSTPCRLQNNSTPCRLQNNSTPCRLQNSSTPCRLQNSSTPCRLQNSSTPCRLQNNSTPCRLQAVTASPSRTLCSFRKARGEAKKCRKVYGVERKDQWCTACRWKKACQRFPD